MTKNDLHINENRWRHRRFFRNPKVHPMLRLGVILLVLTALVILDWWLEVPPFNPIGNGMS